MSLQSQFPADWEKAKDGVPVVVAGITFFLTYYLATQAQVKFQAEVSKLVKIMSIDDATTEAMRTVLVEHIVLGWEELQEEDNGPFVKYSKEELVRLIHTYVGLDIRLMEAASNVALFKAEKQEETKGKSEQPSSL